MSNISKIVTHNNGINKSRIGNHLWAIDWHHDFCPWMTLNRPRPRSQKFCIRYPEYHERYNDWHSGGQMENHQWAFDWGHDL